MANAPETRGRCRPLGAGRGGGGLEATLDSSPVSFMHTYLPLLGSLGHRLDQTLGMGRVRPAGTGAAGARLGPLSKEGTEMIRNGIFLVNGLVYSPSGRLEAWR